MKHALAVSVASPTQGFPPFIGGGPLHSRVLLKSSPPDMPHVLEHVVQAVQDPHWPSRGSAKWQNRVELITSLLQFAKNWGTVEPRFLTKYQGTRKIGSLYRWFVISRFFSIHFKSPSWRISFIIPTTSLYRGSLNRGSTVTSDKSYVA